VFDPRFESQVRLLLRCLPEISRHTCFALKGGTAINLLVRDLPRISVDIDLAYLPLKLRDEALDEIGTELRSLAGEIRRRVAGATVRETSSDGQLIRLVVSTSDAVIKIEPNRVFRGSVYPTEERDLSPAAQRRFEAFVRVQSLSAADLYGSKLCAALDRQHPRDLFDVKLLLDNEGITQEIRKAFVVYLAGCNGPMNELLSPRIKDIKDVYEDHFVGMAQINMTLDDLCEIQRGLAEVLVRTLDDDERAFLLSMKRGTPEWNRLGIEHLEQLPALRWKLLNIRKMSPDKHREALEKLTRILTTASGCQTEK
jgi:predicted nucleotidyltransferase component of viral defense system